MNNNLNGYDQFYAKPKSNEGLSVLVWSGVLTGLLIAVFWLALSSLGTTDLTLKKPEKVLSLDELYQRGRDCNTSGDMECASDAFSHILKIDPSDNRALANLAMAQSKLGNHILAREAFIKYFNRGGAGYDVMAYYAITLDALDRKDQALEWDMKALNANPHLVDVAQSATALLIEMGERQKASHLIEWFIHKNPTAKGYFQDSRARIRKMGQATKTRTI